MTAAGPGTTLPESLGYAGSRSPCQANDCRLCCLDTEMPLLDADVERLEAATGRPRDAFSIDVDGERRLANADGACVFLGPKGCTVYEARPVGCRLYPLVWDEEHESGVLDDDCPYTRSFRIRPRDRAELEEVVARLQARQEGDADA